MYPTDSSTLHVYYQDEQGRIIENQLEGDEWTVTDNDAPQNAIVATDARSGSPLAAISWDSNGGVQRQVFYIDTTDRLTAANTTANHTWSLPYQIPETDPVAPGSLALSACVDTKPAGTGLDGIRVYYSSSTNNRIQEVGMDFFESTSSVWHAWAHFDGSDARSGASCVLDDDDNLVYLRNSTTGELVQWGWNYYDQYVRQTGGWTMNPSAIYTETRTKIAATNDGALGLDRHYVFYQNSEGYIARAWDSGRGHSIHDDMLFVHAANDSPIAATYGPIGSGKSAVYLYRTWDDPSDVGYQQVIITGVVLSEGTMGQPPAFVSR